VCAVCRVLPYSQTCYIQLIDGPFLLENNHWPCVFVWPFQWLRCKRFWKGATEFTSTTRPRDSTIRNVLLIIFWTTLGMLCNLSLPLATRLLVGACVTYRSSFSEPLLVMPWWTLAWLPSFLRDLNIVMNSVGMVTWFASSLMYSRLVSSANVLAVWFRCISCVWEWCGDPGCLCYMACHGEIMMATTTATQQWRWFTLLFVSSVWIQE
jgi:hypothetical protein